MINNDEFALLTLALAFAPGKNTGTGITVCVNLAPVPPYSVLDIFSLGVSFIFVPALFKFSVPGIDVDVNAVPVVESLVLSLTPAPPLRACVSSLLLTVFFSILFFFASA